MSILHTVNKSPFEKNTLESCLNHAREGDAVLLIEDGVYGAVNDTKVAESIKAKNGDVRFYVLGPDLDARGIANGGLIEDIKIVQYDGFVDLVAEHDVTQSWL